MCSIKALEQFAASTAWFHGANLQQVEQKDWQKSRTVVADDLFDK